MGLAKKQPLLVVLAALAVAGCDGRPGAGEMEDRAYAWHDSVMAAMGGERAWQQARYLEFRWNVYRDTTLISDRHHYWDRYGGEYRIEATREGEPLLVLFNVNSRQGQAWLGGEPVSGALNDSLIDRAHAMFINDTYWLLMPYKWRDPGVVLEYLGEETDAEGTWHVLHLSFRDVGRTPGDQYWAYVDDDPPHLMRKWQYHLQGREEKGPVIRWEKWQEFGGLRLATQRIPVDENFRIVFRDIEVSSGVPEQIFSRHPTD